jgi:hypothetical protein
VTGRLVFGVSSLCRFCKGAGRGCRACGGVGFTGSVPAAPDPRSREAAEGIAPVAGSLRARVLALIVARGVMSEQEVEQALGLPGNTVRPRLWELERDGAIRKADKGTTASGRACWRYAAIEGSRAA